MSRFVVFGSCAVTKETVKRLEITEKDCIAAADAGYRQAVALGFTPRLLVGDFDSMALSEVAETGETEVLRFPSHKDDTDTLLALRAGLARGYKEFIILGGVGGERLDHTIANLQTLAFLKEQGCRGLLADHHNTVQILQNETILFPRRQGYLSLFAFGERCRGVSITGVEYPLRNHTLENCFPLGVSNRVTGAVATVTVQTGMLLVIESDPGH